MKFFSKTISIILAATLTAGLFSGCSKKNNTDDVTTITIWSPNSHSKDLMHKIVDDYNRTTGREKGIKIVYVVKESGLGEAIRFALQSGNGPDIFSGLVMSYAPNGQVAAFEDLPGGEEFIKPYEKDMIKTIHTYQGKTYAIPAGRELLGLIYNKDLFREAGIVDENGEPTPPQTYAQIREYAKRISALRDDVFGFALPLKWDGWFNCDVVSGSVQESGRKMYDPITNTFNFDFYKPVLQMYLDMKEDGSLFPDPEGLDNDQARAHFAEGRIGIKFSGGWDVGVLNDQFPAKCEWGVARLPVSELPFKYAQYGSTGAGFMINAESVKRIDAAKLLEVYRFISTDEEVGKKGIVEGKSFPYDPSNYDLSQIKHPKDGWLDYLNLIQYGGNSPITPTLTFSDGRDFERGFIQDVWSGKMSVDELIAEMNEKYNRVYKEMVSRGEIDPNIYINPDHDLTLK